MPGQDSAPHTDTPETGNMQRPSWMPSVSFLVVLGSLWFLIVGNGAYWTKRHARTRERYYGGGGELAKLQLELSAIGIRRYAARTGALPESLAQCEADTPQVWDLLAQSEAPGDDTLWYVASGEPWWPKREGRRGATKTPAADGEKPPMPPAPSLDFLGLPILYRAGEAAIVRDGWLHSSEPLRPETLAFARKHGGVPPEAREPFSVGSIFLQDRAANQRLLDRMALAWSVVHLLGLAATIVLACVSSRHPGPDAESRWTKGTAGVFAAFVVLVGLGGMGATCYAATSFRSRHLSTSDRLALLDGAVGRGEVAPQAAALARRFLDGAHGDGTE